MDVEMRLCNCAACGVSFAFPSAIAKRREDDHQSFYCPNGHTNYYPQKSDAEILREKLRMKERELEDMKAAEQKRAADSAKAARLARQKKAKSKKSAPAKSG